MVMPIHPAHFMEDSLMRFDNFNKLIFSGLIQFLKVFWRLVVRRKEELQFYKFVFRNIIAKRRNCVPNFLFNFYQKNLLCLFSDLKSVINSMTDNPYN